MIRLFEHAQRRPRELAGWFALRASEAEFSGARYRTQRPKDPDWQARTVGVAFARHVTNGMGVVQRTEARSLHPERLPASVPVVDVLPAYRGQHIGVALFDVCLRQFAPEQQLSTYVPLEAEGLIGRLKNIGLSPVGERERPMVEGADPITEIQMQAEVGEVQSQIAATYPWVQNAVIVEQYA